MNMISHELKQAFQLRKDNKTDEAILIYGSLWHEHAAGFGEWDGWSYGQCLKVKRRYADLLDICRQLYPRFKSSEMICRLYAWAIYYTRLAGDDQPENKEEFIKAIDAIVKLSPPGKAYSPAIKSVFKLVKFLGEGMQNNWEEIGHWLLKLDKEILSKETYTIDIPGRRKMELASELEEWYSWQSKWLLQTSQWKQCIKICEEALKTLDKWHYSNDIWFARRKAASLSQLGMKAEARDVLHQLIKRKREWFMLADIAELTNENEKALQLYTEAALAFGDPAKKIRVYYNMAVLYQKTGNKELAYELVLLVTVLRHENNWPVPPALEQMLKELGSVPIKFPSAVSIIKKLKDKWLITVQQAGVDPEGKQPVRLKGIIDHFITGGQAGFIKSASGNKKVYFLFRNFQGDKEELKLGLPVSYEIIKSFDKKKNRESEMAVRIRK